MKAKASTDNNINPREMMIKELPHAKQYNYKGRPKTNHDNFTKLRRN